MTESLVWKTTRLPDGCKVALSQLPKGLIPSTEEFDLLWNLHPHERPVIKIHGREVAIPRYQQSYLRDYHFSGQISAAAPLPLPLEPLAQCLKRIDPRLNGLLLNWYEPDHYIGPHPDSEAGLVPDSDIYTLTLGEGRLMRFTHIAKGYTRFDIPLRNGSILKFSLQDTNSHWKHGVPKRKWKGRRISITARAFL